MYISVEISHYPLIDNYSKAVKEFLKLIEETNFEIETTQLSTIILGELEEIMDFLKNSFSKLMSKYPSVFNLKISNSCASKN